MNTRKQRIEAVFDAAIGLNSPEQREVYLVKACGDDRQLRQEIEELLRAYEKAGGFLAANSTESGNDLRPTLLATPLTEGAGSVIDKYKLLEKLGEGGFGVVYMAEQREPVKRRVALKIIKIGMDTREVVARFEAERQALAMMDHPNIAKILDAGVTS